jgi:hypothetical protein
VTLTIPPTIEVVVVRSLLKVMGPHRRRLILYPMNHKFRWIKFLSVLFGGMVVVLTLTLSHFHPSMKIKRKIAAPKDVSSYLFMVSFKIAAPKDSYLFMVSYVISRSLKNKLFEKEDTKLPIFMMVSWSAIFTTALGFLIAFLFYFIIFIKFSFYFLFYFSLYRILCNI